MSPAPRSHHRRRHLSNEELDLWRQVTKTIAPMRAAPVVEAPPEEAGKPAEKLVPAPPAPMGRKGKKPSAAPAEPPKPPVRPPVPPLTQIEPRLRQRLRRGRSDIDRAVDLHGLRQDEAHRRLHGFLAESQRDGAKLVLVITGKGRGAEDAYEEPYGVLRRAVPHWLREPAMRSLVIGFEEATATHGGAGALYVRVRRFGRNKPEDGR
jgi:DNA-nicking Smr family endonuclease